MGFEPVLKLVALSILYSLLEFLLPAGGSKRSAATALRLIALLSAADILVKWMR